MDLLAMSINEEKVYVKVKSTNSGDGPLGMYRDLKGKLIAYDEHLNIMITDCEERIYSMQKDQLTG